MPGENAKSEELSENRDDGDSGSGFKLNAAKNNKYRLSLKDQHDNRTVDSA